MRILDTAILTVLTVAAGAANYQSVSTRISLPVASFHALPLAQTDADTTRVSVPELSGISELLSQIGTMGILAWFCWYVTSRAGPRLAENFKQSLEAERAAHVREITSLNEAWIERQRIANSTIDVQVKALNDACMERQRMANAALDAQIKQQHDDIARMATSVEQMVRHCSEAVIVRMSSGKAEGTP